MKTSWPHTGKQYSIAFNFTSYLFENERSKVINGTKTKKEELVQVCRHECRPPSAAQWAYAIVYMSHDSIWTSLLLMNHWSTNSHFALTRYASYHDPSGSLWDGDVESTVQSSVKCQVSTGVSALLIWPPTRIMPSLSTNGSTLYSELVFRNARFFFLAWFCLSLRRLHLSRREFEAPHGNVRTANIW